MVLRAGWAESFCPSGPYNVDFAPIKVAAMADAPSKSGVHADVRHGKLHHLHPQATTYAVVTASCARPATPRSLVNEWPTTRSHGVQRHLLPVPLNTTIIVNQQVVRLIVKEPANSEIVDDNRHRSQLDRLVQL
uniref:(northern house mosquito) hypothetical protein n=1 Tax=Culex pipiens TaxID=7175 RepID=A0A8D8AJC0_CULPI